MPTYIIACKELGGIVYLTRMGPTQPVAGGGYAPGTPDVWRVVGPGLNPSVQQYNGTSYILTFEYLSHLFTRVVDTSVWPPNIVNPVQVTGGPNPPNPIAYNIQLAQDSLSLRTESNETFGLVAPYFNPPIIQQPIIFDDPLTNSPQQTYSVTLTLAAGYHPEVPSGYTPYYRLYRRTFTPSVGPWTMIMDWTPNTFSYVDSAIGTLQYQYSATWGTDFSYTDQWNSNAHLEGIIGLTYITVDSTVGHKSYQLFLNESLTLGRSSSQAYGLFDSREQFIVETPNDEIDLSKSLIGQSSQTFASFGQRSAFVYTQGSDSLTFPEMGGVTAGVNNFAASSFSTAYIGT